MMLILSAAFYGLFLYSGYRLMRLHLLSCVMHPAAHGIHDPDRSTGGPFYTEIT